MTAAKRESVPAGPAGDVHLCHHSWCTGPRARLRPDPTNHRQPVWLKEPYALIDSKAASPVEQAARPRPSVWHQDGPMSDYVAVNRANWDSRVPHHVAAYGLELFRDDPDHLSGVVRFDRPRMGSVEGLDVVHLQCHIGTDTVSLARLGARSVTGLDFSAPALVAAAELAATAGVNVNFVESELYRAVDALGAGRFDLVYTGIGALCWLPDVRRWAEVGRRYCAPVVGSSCARGIQCYGRSTIPGPTVSWCSPTRTSRPKASRSVSL
jgi:SAM-dependent methyltransferase